MNTVKQIDLPGADDIDRALKILEPSGPAKVIQYAAAIGFSAILLAIVAAIIIRFLRFVL